MDLERARALAGPRPRPAEPAGTLGELAPELAGQGVELLRFDDARARLDLRRWLAPLEEGAPLEALMAEAWPTGGYFVRVPAGVIAEFPLHVSAGVKRFGTVERSLVVLEPGARLTLVDGCTDVGGPGGTRWSLLDVVIGEGAVLSGLSLQSWPADAESRALKRLRVAAGGRVEWTDVSLGARRVEKTIAAELSAGARADVLCAGYAAPGQSQALRLPPWGRALAAGDIEAPGAALSRWPGGDAAALHRFFEPVSRRLPLEFSVEFTRLLEAHLHS